MKYRILPGTSLIVGVIASTDDLKIALKHPYIANAFEWRVDKFLGGFEAGVRELARKHERPIIVTVRDASERGDFLPAGTKRTTLFHENLSIAALIDVEASTAEAMGQVIRDAKARRIGVIISYHRFGKCFSEQELEHAAAVCREFDGDILKLAAEVETPDAFEDYHACVTSLQNNWPMMRIAAMAMGPMGPYSRLVFGREGAPLIYGFLDQSVVPGQVHVSELRKMLAGVAS